MSKIEWTDVTWNPLSGCTRVSEGCRHCYAEKMSGRLEAMGQTKYEGAAKDGRWTGEIRFHPRVLSAPMKWRKPRRVFVCSMSDIFHPDVDDDWIDQIFSVMAGAHAHTFQVLTKRPERAAEWFKRYDGLALSPHDHHAETRMEIGTMPLPNVWLGTSVEDQATADERIPYLLQCPAAVRFVSYEPALGPLWLHRGHQLCPTHDFASGFCSSPCPDIISLDWIIAGGESGPYWRKANPDWFRLVRDECAEAGMAFFMKQMSGKRPIPEDLKVREFPNA